VYLLLSSSLSSSSFSLANSQQQHTPQSPNRLCKKPEKHASTEAAKQTLDNQRCVGNNDHKLTLYNVLGAGGLSFTALNTHHIGGEQGGLRSWRD